MTKKMLVLGGMWAVCAGAWAQAPAAAPKGASGICKDGTYSMAASKSGACAGHKGVQTWYAAVPAAGASATPAKTPPASASAPTPARTPAAMPAPTVTAPKPAAMPPPAPAASAPAAAPATTSSAPAAGKRQSPEQAAAARTAAPGGGKGLVWLNTSTKVYHCSDDTFYGKTKAGAYMSEADAKAKGAHGDRGQSCAGK